jgi:hypothetical protein
MLLGPNKKAAQIIAGEMKQKPYVQKMGEGGMAIEVEIEGPKQDAMMAKEAQAKKILSAMESKDPKALVSAFQGMMDLCSYEAEEPEDEEMSMEGED